MESELKCPVCKHLFVNPVILPCFHSVCLKCAVQLQQPISGTQEDDFDQLSLVSETDSGVVCSPLPSGNSLAITCPGCHKSCLFDENGAGNLCKNRALANIIDRYAESRKLYIECQMCEPGNEPTGGSAQASWFCEQCEVFYCDACLGAFHPQRGPLTTHQLITAIQGRSQQRAKFKILAAKEMNCLEHEDNPFSMFCLMCKIPLCVMCLHDGRHTTHDVQALGQMCRLQKENCATLEESIRSQCATLIEAIQRRRDELISVARLERDNRLAKICDKVTQCSRGLQGTTSLLQLCIEALKEPEPTVFLQIGGLLINRVKNCKQEWNKEHRQTSAMNNFDFEIDYQAAHDQIRMLDFTKNKQDTDSAPGIPIIMVDECGVVNNSMTVSWRSAIDQSFVDAFVLEITDHDNATVFREVYCGQDNICTIDGLHFNTLYNVRVKALNGHGASGYSQVVSLETHSVASFVLDASTAHPDILASENRLVVTADAFDHRLVLGNLGFSSGVHYWELTLTRYEGCTSDVVCGVARYHAARDVMLGKDENGFSMYIDHQRSWFFHNDVHHTRVPLGIRQNDVIGVLLDMDQGTISFYVNGTLQGGAPAFRDLDGVLYPAISVSRFVEISLRTGLDPPSDC
ncbi:E3 ubiquitin-protein ligase TRIM9-like isoform X3 [Varroa destructor]|uniref:E3 ubiquitin-protein ligase TRIM9 n=1 Tax=Varroa destructor TaxID=109461 RepID=A0A7M7JTY8_VARDE|nr:E3 ubiquitin-protein ligase TRIM9-like isoform X3 [Varroa destructor]